ncbi:Transposase [Cordylochernes scorpioides]|uniref:Transposase n=1 Tax=Cordylochernes scorpioides TaxID=51811 RepID=A0ABY6L7N3_9ARAC|nr:Transposase [Cordylochernes scorpioides]
MKASLSPKTSAKSAKDVTQEEMHALLSKLKDLVPNMPRNRKLSKLEIIQYVIDYILDLQMALQAPKPPVSNPSRQPLCALSTTANTYCSATHLEWSQGFESLLYDYSGHRDLNHCYLPSVNLPEFGDIHLLLYADDIAIIGESRMNLQKKIKILKEYLDENLMTLNESKSKIMVFRNGGAAAYQITSLKCPRYIRIVHGSLLTICCVGTPSGMTPAGRFPPFWLLGVSAFLVPDFGTHHGGLSHAKILSDHSISTRTISRRLVANGLHSCRPLRRLPLTPPNRRQRLEWCRARSTWMTEWHRVVFSDESRFCLSSDSRRVRVWRRRGERSNPAAIVERPTVRQRGIMVWGAIAYDSRSPLLRIQGTMTAQRYVDDVLRPVTLPYLQGVPNALYQQDNARPHTARISQQALQDVQMLPWPPYSPDLSPIEHVWDIIGRRLHALPQPRSEDELWQMVEREWRAIPQDAIRTLIDSLPRRVAACIAVRGGPTCY